MKKISKIAGVTLGLVLVGSSVFAQSLADAKRAIDAEQYQKAKSMLKNLTVTQANNDENYFYLGWVYLVQDYTDSAKTAFMKGISINQKSAINYAGLGVVSHLTNDAVGKTSNFAQVAAYAGKKDSKPYLYMGEGLLMPLPGSKVVNTADAEAAIAALNKAKVANPKDIDAAIALGDAYRSQKNTTDAYNNYTAALAIDPKSPAARVAQGVLWTNAHNFDGAVVEFKGAIETDPNYGPAYREWAETDLLWANDSKAVASEKVQEGVEKYSKYLSLTDESEENLVRYADFLISAGKYQELQEVATQLSKSSGTNARAFRYLGYAAYENKDYTSGLTAINNWFSKAEPTRILPRDYLYQGRLLISGAKDTVGGVAALKKAADLDSTLLEPVYTDIINLRKAQKNYPEVAKGYDELISKMHGKAPIVNYIYSGIYNYFSFSSKNPDSTLLVKADSSLSFANQKLTKPSLDVFIYRARIADLKDNKDLTKMVGYAKPYYEKYIAALTAEPSNDPRFKKNLAEAYAYMGNYAVYHDKDDAKALEMYTKAQELDPANPQAKYYFDQKAAATAPKAAPKKSK